MSAGADDLSVPAALNSWNDVGERGAIVSGESEMDVPWLVMIRPLVCRSSPSTLAIPVSPIVTLTPLSGSIGTTTGLS